MSPYPEKLLHWIWANQQFAHQKIHLPEGQKVKIQYPGDPNPSDGPDFLNANIQIGSLIWHGDVEIHWNVTDWKKHGHYRDANYNRVILHVVYTKTTQTVWREDGTKVPALSVESLIDEPLNTFIDQYQSSPALPCSAQISYISHEVFQQQLEKSQREYFERKVNDLISFYNPELKPSEAWLKAFAISLFDGLGIAYNREPMQKLFHQLFPLLNKTKSANDLKIRALKIADVGNGSTDFGWKHKGCRPGNHPNLRIQQAAELLWFICSIPFERWFNCKPAGLWKQLTGSITTKPGLGRERASILYGTVFLPALYALGNLFFAEKNKTAALSEWENHHAHIPESLLQSFKNAGLPPSVYSKKLGAVHQLRAYCQPRHCQQCKVFKSIISA